ncbi:hypothetical protein QR680_006715 [Steinernema hermaphroditum]|uniref:Uncharacterized protein n=1 Tax=Steinernema hermaphroditum TaxID=289476 RepID=A0AA39HW94_9BILA|nr:hypothetical protein QR680_006715 [Steinernema hermaphroditum]
MNRLPLNFYDALFSMLYTPTIGKLRDLVGPYGAFAHEMFENRYDYAFNIKNDVIVKEEIYNYSRCGFESSTTPREKFMELVSIVLCGPYEGPVKCNISERIREVQGDHECDLSVLSDTISKEWIDWACLWKGLTCFSLLEELEETAIELCQQLVDTCKLEQLVVCYEGCGAIEFGLIKSVLVQDQFDTLRLTFYDAAVLEELFQFCAENSARLKGKNIQLQSPEVCDVSVSTLLEGKLELCSNEESDSIVKDHRFFYRSILRESSRPYKFLNGQSLAYLFLECNGKEKEVGELEFLKKTDDIIIFFV